MILQKPMASELFHHLFFLLFLLFPFSTFAQTYTNVSLGSSLTANDNTHPWLSPSGEFAFGFQKLGNSYLLAIWYEKISEKTIIWSANGENPAQQGSQIQLTTDGRFILTDPEGKQMWAPPLLGYGIGYAAMLNDGNFVLSNKNGSSILWQSFDEPTDTLLPTQVLNQGSRLLARFSETNYSSGRFEFLLQTDGNLALYTTTYPLDSINSDYYSTMTTGSGYQVIFNQSGLVYLIAKNGTILANIAPNSSLSTQFYQRLILEYDGVLRQYIYPKSANSTGKWPMAWSLLAFIPSDICTSVIQNTGGGACGFNSYCILGSDQRPSCECPPGYTFFDPNYTWGGCKPNFVPQNCDEETKETDLFDFVEMVNTDWPLSDYEYYQPVTEDWCREMCLNDCFCDVAIFRGGNCWKKKNPLSNGKMDPSVGGKALIKFRKDNSTAKPGSDKDKDQHGLIVTGLVLLSSSVFLNFALLSTIVLAAVRFQNRRLTIAEPYSVNLRSFSYKELEEATYNFKEELGRGAYSTVYKGVLKYGLEKIIAVKRLDKMVGEGDKEFEAEVTAINRTNHKNLVQLLGYCKEGQNHLLVYEFMSNGSLASFLFENQRPNWYKRVEIAFGTARGLCYLHEECSIQILHCDIKPQNVLLDDSFQAKISDFGLAKLLKTDQTRTMTAIRGTKGYVAPEWFKNMPITAKVDVYSYGILLLELICCRRNMEMEKVSCENEIILADWACDCYHEHNLRILVQNDEEALSDMKRVERFVMIAIWCIQDDPSMRPTMKKVTQMLEGAVQVSPPPDPCSFISSI